METIITSYCRIKNNSIVVNDELFLKSDPNETLTDFISICYKKTELNYPKLFKMDKLCKLGVIAAELVIRSTEGFNEIPKNEIALIFVNNSSSLDSDRNHLAAIADKQHYFPSPAVFVYTLPNIVIGEIAIKHKITGENAFFISERFDAELLFNYSNILLQNQNASALICGWVNVDGQSADALVYCIKNPTFKQENQGFQKIHSPENLKKSYTSIT